MRRYHIIISAISFFALVAIISQVIAQPTNNKADAPAQVWEYRVQLITDFVQTDVAALEKKLNELGHEGWELSQQMGLTVVFKRPLR
jgi:hypothetical protein